MKNVSLLLMITLLMSCGLGDVLEWYEKVKKT